ncbi:hypothetical protein [Nonomuraea guangzhouensis]|uniref:Uncharacterized protein n=1 Tax=Nonomuraea guangzhouensis TaxID=1291555 RepID=A0ABW4GW95_9ACTN|nr:hypothetical protein [Nonomuraea guangzhouensis]
MTKDCALASQVLSAVGDWACGDGTPTHDAQPYRDVTRAVFEGLAWLEDHQPSGAMIARVGIHTVNLYGPDVRVQVFFDLEPEDGLFAARIAFLRGDGSQPVPRITDHVAARLTASLHRITLPTEVTRLPYMPGARTDLVAYGTRHHLGGSLAAAYQRCVDADTTDRPFIARAYRGRPSDRDAALAAIGRLHVPHGWTAQPSLAWIGGTS